MYEWKPPSGLGRHYTQTFFDLSPATAYIYSFCYSFQPSSILPKKESHLGKPQLGSHFFFLHKSDDVPDREIIEFTTPTEYFWGKIILLVDTCRPMLIESLSRKMCPINTLSIAFYSDLFFIYIMAVHSFTLNKPQSFKINLYAFQKSGFWLNFSRWSHVWAASCCIRIDSSSATLKSILEFFSPQTLFALHLDGTRGLSLIMSHPYCFVTDVM